MNKIEGMDIQNDQSIGSLLADYEAFASRLGELLRQEQSHLARGGSLEDSMEEKKELLGAISELNNRLKIYGRDRGPMGDSVKARVEVLQHKLMSILKLDRTVEKQYLSHSVGAPARPQLVPVLSRVGQMYGKGNGGQV